MIKNLRFYYHFIQTLISKKYKRGLVLTVSLVGLIVLIRFLAVIGASEALSEKITKPTYIEGIIGTVDTLNPVYEETLAEKEINALVFRGLSKINEDGTLEPDLAESFSRKTSTRYVFKLKKDIFWHDGKPITADDVAHTIELTQKPNPPSALSSNFKDVKVTKIDEKTVEFELKEPFSPFVLNTTIGLVPKHISLEEYRPIGAGDFQVKEISEEKIVIESEFSKVVFKLYKTKKEAILALKLGEIDGLGGLSFFDIEIFKFWPNFNIFSSNLQQRQVALFFNLKDKSLSSKELRQAYLSGTPRELIAKILPEFNLKISNSSLPLDSWVSRPEESQTDFEPDEALTQLKKLGWKKEGDYLKKDNDILKLEITTSDDPELGEVASIIKDSYETLGIQVTIRRLSIKELKDTVIPERRFQSLLLIQELNVDPDQYSLWHSSQRNDANITSLNSDKIDKTLEDGRKVFDRKERIFSYTTFNRIFNDEVPAIFLYHPKYFWLVNSRVENIELVSFIKTSDRFKNIEQWEYKNKSILSF